MNFNIKKSGPVAPSSVASFQPAATQARQGDCINLILFGETGVGKSSLINTFANLLAFESFDRADKEEPKCVIPCSFKTQDENFNLATVYVGDKTQLEGPNFVSAGETVTRKPQSYFFDVNVNGSMRKMHVIDTPPVGDTRGFEQDKENMRYVIDYIRGLEGLNAICILLPPNARFTLQFRYCFKELLVNLSRGAAPNICFCYTNSRGTFFKPGECRTILLEELAKIEREDNVTIPRQGNFFCFDSEIFRYLGAKKHGIRFDQFEVDSYKQAWEKNSKSLLGLISHAANLPAASVKSIYLLSTARRCLMELAKHVRDLSNNIQANKLAKYIKRNSIVYYNPDLEEYLNLLIREEEQKMAAGCNNTLDIYRLLIVKADFLAKVDILTKSLQASRDVIATEADIQHFIYQPS